MHCGPSPSVSQPVRLSRHRAIFPFTSSDRTHPTARSRWHQGPGPVTGPDLGMLMSDLIIRHRPMLPSAKTCPALRSKAVRPLDSGGAKAKILLTLALTTVLDGAGSR
jgi:hypothetical protein